MRNTENLIAILTLLALSSAPNTAPAAPLSELALVAVNTATRANTQLDRDLFTAVSAGDIVRAKRLLAQGADLRARQQPWNLTPLLVAPDVSLEMVRFLVGRGAEINVADKEGTTVLMKAVRANAPAIVDFLVKKGADVHAVDGHGNTALVLAVLLSNPEIVRDLIQHGADVNVVTDSGATPLAVIKRERQAAEAMNPAADMAMPATMHMHHAHPMRTKAQALAQTKAVMELLSKAGATRDQQPLQRTEAQRHAAHHAHRYHEASAPSGTRASPLHEAQATTP